MRVYLFANARPALPFIFDGGAERTTYSLVSGLAGKGFPVVQVCTFPRNNIDLAVANAMKMGASFTRKSGQLDPALTVCTSKDHLLVRDGSLWIVAVDISEFRSVCSALLSNPYTKLVITWLKGSVDVIDIARGFQVPTVLRIVGPYSFEGYPPVTSDTIMLANSPMTSHSASRYYQRDVGFLLGVIDHALYVAPVKTPRYITYINPRTEKGIHLFCKIAALLPDMPFLVVRGWSRDNFTGDELQALEFIRSLPNVKLMSPRSDMRDVYGLTRILVVPSRWQESWARVIGEAQANGIPVVASNRGSSALNVGQGGVVLNYGQPDLWAAVIRRIYDDSELLSTLATNALLNIRRFDAATLVQNYADYFSICAERRQGELPQTIEDTVKMFYAERDANGLPQIVPREVSMCIESDIPEPAYS